MNLITLATSRFGPPLAMSFCQVMNIHHAYSISDWLASYAARNREAQLIQALRVNMAVVHGVSLDNPKTDRAVARLLQNTLRGYVDYFKALRGGEGMTSSCICDQSLLNTIRECTANGQGVVLVGIHTCGLDNCFSIIQKHLPDIQVLGMSTPKANNRIMHNLRVNLGLNVTPISVDSLRQAVERLKGGGVVAIAADLPVENGEEMVFFGKKAKLTTGHTRLALKTGAKVILILSRKTDDGIYRLVHEHVPQPERTGDRNLDAIRWAEKTLASMERLIRNRPDEWFIPLPVWKLVGHSGILKG